MNKMICRFIIIANTVELSLWTCAFISKKYQIKKLEWVCCKKTQKKVPDQLLVCGVGEGPDGFQTDYKGV